MYILYMPIFTLLAIKIETFSFETSSKFSMCIEELKLLNKSKKKL